MDPENLKNLDFRRFKFQTIDIGELLGLLWDPLGSPWTALGSPRGHPSKLMEGCSKSDLVCQKWRRVVQNQISEGGRELSSTAYSSKICVFGTRHRSRGNHRSRGSGGRIRGSDPPSHTRRGPGWRQLHKLPQINWERWRDAATPRCFFLRLGSSGDLLGLLKFICND